MKFAMFSKMALAGVAAFALTASANAAVVSWSTAEFTNVNQIDNTGTTLTAYATGGSSAITMNGVNFVPGNVGGGSNGDGGYFDSGIYSVTGLTSAEADNLLDNTNYGPGGGNTLVQTTGLTIGDDYLVQLVVGDHRQPAFTLDLGYDTPKTWNLTGVDVLDKTVLATGTFTATAATQDLQVLFVEGTNLHSLSTYQVRNITGVGVPEPSTALLALVGLGLAAAFRRRR